jgi:hypothetical protein
MLETFMRQYLSLLGLLFLGVGALALAGSARAETPRPKTLPGEDSLRTQRSRLLLPSASPFHAPFSIN